VGVATQLFFLGPSLGAKVIHCSQFVHFPVGNLSPSTAVVAIFLNRGQSTPGPSQRYFAVMRTRGIFS
jgi:hypothetical protein